MASPEWLDRDFYADLGVSTEASAEEIKKAYRQLARQNHPDANQGDADAEARFKTVSEAYTVLSDPEKRAEYDQARQMAATGARGAGFGSGWQESGPATGGRSEYVDLGDLFGGGAGMGMGDAQALFDRLFDDAPFGAGPGRNQRQGADVEAELTLDFRTAVRGDTLALQLTGPAGTRTRQVRIPAGVLDGQRIRLRGQGESAAGGPAGDLYVRLHVEPDQVFGRSGADLTLVLPVTVPELVFGTTVDVPTLDDTVSIRVPPQSTSGRVLRVREHGIPHGKQRNGDLLVTLEAAVPEQHDQDALEALRAYAEATADFDPRAGLRRSDRRAGA